MKHRTLVMAIAPLVEIADAHDGIIEMKARNALGTRIGFFQVAAADMDAQLVDDLLAWQARHSKQGASLSIVRPSAFPSP